MNINIIKKFKNRGKNSRDLKKFGLILIIGLLMQVIFVSNIEHSVAVDEGNPGLRTGQKMVYNPVAEEIILFGGNRGNGDTSLLDTVWKYNISQSEWVEINPGLSPISRYNHAMVYLPGNNSILLFGGRKNSDYTQLDDTWKYDLRTNTWEEIICTPKPPARQFSSLTYDSQSERALLFGGFGQNEEHLNDLWEFTPENNTWTEITTTNAPQSRYGHSLIYRNATNNAYLFGGRTLGLNDDLWKFDPSINAWNSVVTSTKPLQRYLHSMEYCSESDLGFLFGGDNENTQGRALDDTWVFNFTANSWILIQPETSPVSRLIYSMCYDSALNQVYIYGGLTDDYQVCLGDFWQFDFTSSNWIEIGDGSKGSIEGYQGIGISIMSSIAVCTLIIIRKKRSTAFRI
ncbi:Kelch repeat-containing protein [Promethearchaeum syntrophicum]|uniref:Kelch repeat-containing protein n=1 Tax=Promethearchaeum syntrophicum TaxID=2594042 RepID=A0A5B9D6Y5_9ARCH|nr:kelch repeat-containing protein [Candidatus Prometheoarchaeum syntrophicum]